MIVLFCIIQDVISDVSRVKLFNNQTLYAFELSENKTLHDQTDRNQNHGETEFGNLKPKST